MNSRLDSTRAIGNAIQWVALRHHMLRKHGYFDGIDNRMAVPVPG